MAGGEKRKKEGDGRGKNKKAKYMSSSSRQNTGGPVLPYKSRGFLVSCPSGKERQAGHEALHVLQSYYEAALVPAETSEKEEGGEKGEDISSQIDKEFSDLRNPEKQVFNSIKTGISGLCFINMKRGVPGPGPADILVAIADDVQKTKQSKTRFCMRFTPVDTVCHGTLDEMRKAASDVVLPHFPQEGPAKTFAVNYEHRASANLDRMAVINAVLDGVAQPPHKANLKTPELSILVETMKNVCAIGVAPRYRELAKFNFQELCVADEKKAEERKDGGGNKTDSTAVETNNAEGKVVPEAVKDGAIEDKGASDAEKVGANGIDEAKDAEKGGAKEDSSSGKAEAE